MHCPTTGEGANLAAEAERVLQEDAVEVPIRRIASEVSQVCIAVHTWARSCVTCCLHKLPIAPARLAAASEWQPRACRTMACRKMLKIACVGG
jgi:hypothetical protein